MDVLSGKKPWDSEHLKVKARLVTSLLEELAQRNEFFWLRKNNDIQEERPRGTEGQMRMTASDGATRACGKL